MEAGNMKRLCEYFSIMKELDNYIAKKDQIKIVYTQKDKP